MLHSNPQIKMRIVTKKKAQVKPSSRLVCEKCGGTIKHALFGSLKDKQELQSRHSDRQFDIDFTKVLVHPGVDKESVDHDMGQPSGRLNFEDPTLENSDSEDLQKTPPLSTSPQA